MRRLLSAALIFVALGPVPGTQQRLPSIDLTSQQVAARPLRHPVGEAGMLRFVRGWHLVSPNDPFGAYSALAFIGPDRFPPVGATALRPRSTPAPSGGGIGSAPGGERE